MGTSHGKAYWEDHIESWRRSGLTQVAYCKTQGLSSKTFHRWRTKCRDSAAEQDQSLTLVPLRISTTNKGSALHLHSPGGWRIDLSGIPLAELAAMLRQLP